MERGSNATYANGHVLYLRDGVLVAQAIDLDRLELTGQAASLVEQVQVTGESASEVAGAFSVSQTGVLAYQTGPRISSQLVWYNRAGQRLSAVGAPGDYVDVALSPDNVRVATSVINPAQGTTRDVWTFDVARGVGERFTFGNGDDFGPNWSQPGGDRIVYSSLRQGGIHLYEKPVRQAGREALLLQDELGKFNASPAANGRHLVYVGGGGIIARSDIWVLPLGGDKKAFPFLDSDFLESQPQFSPNGRWLAFISNKSGRHEVFVTSFPGRESEQLISTGGGMSPRWRRDGQEMFYLAPDGTLTATSVNGRGPRFEVLGAARPLFRIRTRASRLDAYSYDVAADGKRFLVNTLLEEIAPPISLIVNWTATR